MRFGTKIIFAATAIVAIACAAMFSFPRLPGLLTMMAITVIMHAVCVSWIVWGKHFQRAFAIGYSIAIFPSAILMIYASMVAAQEIYMAVSNISTISDDDHMLRPLFAELWGFSLLGGFAAIAGRWLGMPNQMSSKVESDPTKLNI